MMAHSANDCRVRKKKAGGETQGVRWADAGSGV